jgi:tetratricopeptide (TPR) repeat protein
MKYYHILPPALIGVSMVLVQSQIAVAISPQEVEKIGREITVRIVDSQNPTNAGSGIIVKRSGNTYTVLTAYHVVKSDKKYQIFTPDGQSNQLQSVKRLQGVDLAVAEFSSSKTYSVAKIGNSDKATRTTTVYVAGFPAPRGAIPNPEFFLNKGQVNANGAAQSEGYNIIYDNDTLGGMSGGPVLNEQGEVVAIHGRADEQEIGEKSQSKIVTGIGITIYSALRQMLAVGVDVGVRPPGVVAAAPKADDFYIRANNKARQKDYKGAIADYTEAIRLNPNYDAAYNNRGVVRRRLGDKQGAIADFNSALKINPNDADVYVNRGVARDNLGELQGAIADYNTALKINPNYALAYNNRGIVRRQLGDKQGAIADFNSALKINPNYAYAYTGRGVVRYDLKDLQGAIADYNSAIKIIPNEAKLYYNRGIARYDLGDHKGAIADYNTAIKINPNNAEAYNNRGNARRQLGDNQGAIADFNSAIKINPNYAQAYGNRGVARHILGDKQGAIADYNSALKINPNYAEAYTGRGVARYILGDKQGAIADYNSALKINPNYAEAYNNRGVARAAIGDKQSGIADLQKAADLFQQQGNTQLYQKALELIRKLQQ